MPVFVDYLPLCAAPSEYKEENGLLQWLGREPMECIIRNVRPQDELSWHFLMLRAGFINPYSPGPESAMHDY